MYWQSLSLQFLQSLFPAQAGSRNAGADVIPGLAQPPSGRRRLAPPSRAFLRQGIPAPARGPQWKPVTPAPAAAGLPGLGQGRLGGGAASTRCPAPTLGCGGGGRRAQPSLCAPSPTSSRSTSHEREVPGAAAGTITISVQRMGMSEVCKRAYVHGPSCMPETPRGRILRGRHCGLAWPGLALGRGWKILA